MRAHPPTVPLDRGAEAVLAGRAGGAYGREDAASTRVELLVAGPRGAERELLDPVAAERRMGMAVDKAGNRAEAAAVHLDHLGVEHR